MAIFLHTVLEGVVSSLRCVGMVSKQILNGITAPLHALIEYLVQIFFKKYGQNSHYYFLGKDCKIVHFLHTNKFSISNDVSCEGTNDHFEKIVAHTNSI